MTESSALRCFWMLEKKCDEDSETGRAGVKLMNN